MLEKMVQRRRWFANFSSPMSSKATGTKQKGACAARKTAGESKRNEEKFQSVRD
jgi:hypothetical protein